MAASSSAAIAVTDGPERIRIGSAKPKSSRGGSNILLAWCKEKNLFKPETNDGVPSHLMLDNGIIYCPEHLYKEWLSKYADTIRANQILCMSEQRTEVFVAFYDIDMASLTELKSEQLELLVTTIQSEMRRFYSAVSPHQLDDLLMCIMLASDPKRRSVDGHEVVQYGLHPVFPNLRVNSHQMLMMREALLVRLTKDFGKRDPPSTWPDVVDPQVFGRNGIRMAFSNRGYVSCPSCGGKKDDADTCEKRHLHIMKDNHACVMAERPYRPVAVLSGSGVRLRELEQTLLPNIYRVVELTGIRCSSKSVTTPGWEAPRGSPAYSPSLLHGKKPIVSPGSSDSDHKRQSKLEDKMFKPSKSTHVVSPTTPAFCQIQTMVRAMHPMYKNIEVKRVTFDPRTCKYFVQVKGEGNRYCANVQREHEHSPIYFMITEKGVQQCCYNGSQTLDGRQYRVFCSDFKSTPAPLSGSVYNLLYAHTLRKNGSRRLRHDQLVAESKFTLARNAEAALLLINSTFAPQKIFEKDEAVDPDAAKTKWDDLDSEYVTSSSPPQNQHQHIVSMFGSGSGGGSSSASSAAAAPTGAKSSVRRPKKAGPRSRRKDKQAEPGRPPSRKRQKHTAPPISSVELDDLAPRDTDEKKEEQKKEESPSERKNAATSKSAMRQRQHRGAVHSSADGSDESDSDEEEDGENDNARQLEFQHQLSSRVAFQDEDDDYNSDVEDD